MNTSFDIHVEVTPAELTNWDAMVKHYGTGDYQGLIMKLLNDAVQRMIREAILEEKCLLPYGSEVYVTYGDNDKVKGRITLVDIEDSDYPYRVEFHGTGDSQWVRENQVKLINCKE